MTLEKLVQFRHYFIGPDFLYTLFDYVTLKIFVLKPSFLARLSVCHKQNTKLKSPKTAAASRIASIMQRDFCFRSSHCQGMFAFTTGEYWHSAKLKSTSSLMWSSANGQKLILKALLNSCFLPILLNEKRRGDSRSLGGNKRAKLGGAFSQEALLIIPL